MDIHIVIDILQASLYWVVVFLIFLAYAMVRAKRSLVNLILGLYVGLLLYMNFPYFDALGAYMSSPSLLRIVVFAAATVGATYVFGQLLRSDYEEPAFYDINKKVLLALLGSVLIMIYSFHVLPVTDFITPGEPIQNLFAESDRFFWWLILPLAALLAV